MPLDSIRRALDLSDKIRADFDPARAAALTVRMELAGILREGETPADLYMALSNLVANCATRLAAYGPERQVVAAFHHDVRLALLTRPEELKPHVTNPH